MHMHNITYGFILRPSCSSTNMACNALCVYYYSPLCVDRRLSFIWFRNYTVIRFKLLNHYGAYRGVKI